MILNYMSQAASLFQAYPAVSILQCLAEWSTLLWYMRPLPARELSRTQMLLIYAVFLGASITLHLQNYWISRYFPLYMLLCLGFLRAIKDISLPGSVFIICPFGLGMELSRLPCYDGLLNLLLARASTFLPSLLCVLISVGTYFLLLCLNTLWMRKRTENFEKLDVTVWQLLSFVFPLALYVAVRQYVFSCMEFLNFTRWLHLELLQLSLLAFAELETLSAGRMAATQIERNELLEQQLLAEKRQQQYALQLQSIDAVNRRYHDLKHYLTAMECMNSEEASASVQALQEEIEAYECMQKTGNATLDILLFERMRECQKKGIRLVPYVDGRQIGFLHVSDLCVIFGNAMDNAIEAASRLKYVNMREISVKIGVSDQFLILHFHNYYDGTLNSKGEKLLTRKEDSQAHGYGLKNIREAVEKYNGTAAFEANGSEFSLNLLIPIPTGEDAGNTGRSFSSHSGSASS